MKAEIRHRISELRLWEDDNAVYGDPYQIFLEVIWITKDSIEFVGLTEKIKRVHWRAIKTFCESYGIKKILARRFRNSVEYEHWIIVEEWTKRDCK